MPSELVFPPIPVISGPTASGKTAVAVELAKVINGEIISADSMQVYRHLSIGTAKPTAEELQGIACHLIDHVNPDEQYHLGRFVEEARHCIGEIRGRGRQPIICGGTGMYIRGLIYGVFDRGEANAKIRAALIQRLEKEGLAALYSELRQVDPVSAERYGCNDRQRILRALEVYQNCGEPFSSFHRQSTAKPVIPARILVLSRPRSELYNKINSRVDDMLLHGLLDEVRNYLAMGWSYENPAIKALGYRELIDAVENRIPIQAALATMKQRSRNYAKRQETWFRAITDAILIECDNKSPAGITREILPYFQNASASITQGDCKH